MAARQVARGLRDSPAKMAAYSKPQRAPKLILLKDAEAEEGERRHRQA